MDRRPLVVVANVDVHPAAEELAELGEVASCGCATEFSRIVRGALLRVGRGAGARRLRLRLAARRARVDEVLDHGLASMAGGVVEGGATPAVDGRVLRARLFDEELDHVEEAL